MQTPTPDNAIVVTYHKHGHELLRCPIVGFEQRLRSAGMLEVKTLAAIEEEVADKVEAAIAFAEAGEWEPVEDLSGDVYLPTANG